MKIFEITEAPRGRPETVVSKGKPDWYDRAVKLKTDNPNITASEIGRQLGVNYHLVIYWLTGKDFIHNRRRPIDRPPESFPFKPGVFPNISSKKYFDGAKPEWYDQALQMAKAGETYKDIGKKFGVGTTTVSNWLVKGRKNNITGKVINPDAEMEPRVIRGKKLDVNLLNDLVADPDLNDTDILELIADEYGKTAASTVKTMLPQLKQQQKASRTSAQVIDKTASGIDDPKISAAK